MPISKLETAENTEEPVVEQLNTFLKSDNTGLRKDMDLPTLAASAVRTSLAGYGDAADTYDFIEREDVQLAAELGIILGWKEVNADGYAPYLLFREKRLKLLMQDEPKMGEVLATAERLGISDEEAVTNHIVLGYLYESARKELRYFMRNVGVSAGTMQEFGARNTMNFTTLEGISGTDDDINEEFIERFVLANKKDEFGHQVNLLDLGYHNAVSSHVTRLASQILDIDQELNFPEHDIEFDAPMIQEIFLSSVKRTLLSRRGYSGLSPTGTPRYRVPDPVSLKVEEELIDAMLYRGERSTSAYYLKDFLKKKPTEWGHAFARRGTSGGTARFGDYNEVRDNVMEHLYNRTSTYTGKYKGEWFDEDGNLILEVVPIGLINDLCDLYPEVRTGIELRKKAWQRMRHLMEERSEELQQEFKRSLEEYLIRKNGKVL